MHRFYFFPLAPASVRRSVSSSWKVSTRDTVPAFAVAADGAVSVGADYDVAVYFRL
jgi:hypothetical protein